MSNFTLPSILFSVISASATTFLLHGQAAEVPLPAEPATLEERLTSVRAQIEERTAAGREVPLRMEREADRLQTALCEQGIVTHCPDGIPLAKNVDIDKLAYAVAVAETSNCTKGTGRTESHRNCHGIRGCSKGQCYFKTYATHEESFIAFKKLWLTKYGDRFPTLQDARKYSGGEGTSWLQRVTIAYNRTASQQ